MVSSSISPFATRLQDEIGFGDKGMVRKYLVKDRKRQAMLICLQTGIEIPEHTSSFDGFLTVIQGRGVFLLAEREIVLEPGVFIELPANTRHGLRVTEDLAILKIVDSHEPYESSASKKSCQESPRGSLPRSGTCAETLVEILKPYLQNGAMSESPPLTKGKAIAHPLMNWL